MGLLEALKQYASDAAGGSLNPEVGNTLSGLLNYGKDRAKYIGGLLDDSSPINKDFKNWHDRTQLGLADLIAGKEGPQADYGYSQIMNMAGVAPVGMTKAIVGPQHEALLLAQKRAALPVEQYGLGLPPNNTPQMRADAMNMVTRFQHGSPDDFTAIDMSRLQRSDAGYLGKGFYGGQEGGSAYADVAAYPLVADVTSMRKIDNSNWNVDSPYSEVASRFGQSSDAAFKRKVSEDFAKEMQAKGYTGIIDTAGGDGQGIAQLVAYNPDVVRSRFAAFDPWRRNSTIAALMGVAAPDLLAKDNKNSHSSRFI